MNENKKSSFSELVLTGRSPSIEVEQSLKEIEALIVNESAFVKIVDTAGAHYLLPKSVIKLVKSHCE